MTPQSFLAVVALLLPALAAAADESVLTLPIRFHITQGAMMTVKDQPMEVWVKPDDLTGPVLTEMNRIWKPANIQFVVERAQVEPLLQPADFAELLKSVENARRGEEEKLGSRRTANIAKLLDPARLHPTAHNIYLCRGRSKSGQRRSKSGQRDGAKPDFFELAAK